MPYKNKEEYNAYMKRYRARKSANWQNTEPEPEKYEPEQSPELQASEDAFRKPIDPFEGFGEDKKGMVVVCSTCGRPLNRGRCPVCDYDPD